MKGIVLSPTMKISTTYDVIAHEYPPIEELKFFALYADNIALAKVKNARCNINISGGGPYGNVEAGEPNSKEVLDAVLTLQKENILQAWEIGVNPDELHKPMNDMLLNVEVDGFIGSQYNEVSVCAKAKIMRYLNENRNDVWAMGGSNHDMILPPSIGREEDNLVLQLFYKLPVPDESIHIDEVLSFRTNRKSEYDQFSAAFDDLCKLIDSRYQDKEVFQKAINRLEKITFIISNLADEIGINNKYTGFAVMISPGVMEALSVIENIALIAGLNPNNDILINMALAGINMASSKLKNAIKINLKKMHDPFCGNHELYRDYAYLLPIVQKNKRLANRN